MLCRFNIILDLDETFVSHINNKRKEEAYLPKEVFTRLRHFQNNFQEKDQSFSYTMFVRPHFDEVVDFLFDNFNVGVITAGTYKYALNIIKDGLLQGKPNRHLAFFFSRETFTPERYGIGGTKNLEYIFRVAKPFMFTPCNTLLIDDLPSVMQTNLFNVLQVPAWKILTGTKEEKTFNKASLQDVAWKSVAKVCKHLVSIAEKMPCTLQTYYTPCKDISTPLMKWVKSPKQYTGEDHQLAFANWDEEA